MHMTREKFAVLEMYAESRTTDNKTLPLRTPQRQNMKTLPAFFLQARRSDKTPANI